MLGDLPAKTFAVLAIFAVSFSLLTVSGYIRKSAVWDEPAHLTAGYLALKYGDYTMRLGHLPFSRMWNAWPLLAMDGVSMDPNSPDLRAERQYHFAEDFLYRKNNADRLLYAARFMTVLPGILLGVLLFCWGKELYGFWPAVITLGFYTLEPNLLAHSSLVTNDLSIACFMFGAVYFLWRTAGVITVWNLFGLACFFSLAQITKLTGVILVPAIGLLLLVCVGHPSPWHVAVGRGKDISQRWLKALVAMLVGCTLFLSAYLALWAVYGFRYSPTPAGVEQLRVTPAPNAAERAPRLAAVVNWVDCHHLLPNAAVQGYLFMNSVLQPRPTYLLGEVSDQGWWYYFPLAFLMKTPATLVVLLVIGLALSVMRRYNLAKDESFVLLPIGLCLISAMATPYNIGVRHILPIYPFVLLVAGKAIAELLVGWRRSVLAALTAVWLIEFAAVYPHYLTFFNLAVGGPGHGHRYLLDSNLDWGQDLKPLKQWMDQNQVDQINLSYFGAADPAYYGINCTYLPGAPFFAEDRVTAPTLPGYLAISATHLHGVYFFEDGREFYRPFLEKTPVTVIGNSIFVYWQDDKWW